MEQDEGTIAKKRLLEGSERADLTELQDMQKIVSHTDSE